MATKPTLESMRQAHEDLERLEHLGAAALALSTGADLDTSRIPESHSARTSVRSAEHLAAGLAEEACACARVLKEGYASADMEAAAAGKRDPAAVLSEFYESLRDVKALHHVDGASLWDGSAADAAILGAVPPPPGFSGEEGGGRYLDLQEQFASYLNVVYQNPRAGVSGHQEDGKADGKGRNGKRSRKRARSGKAVDILKGEGDSAEQAQRIDYREYVERAVSDPGAVPVTVRGTKAYEMYLSELLEYLVVFAEKLHPLAGMRQQVKDAELHVCRDLLDRLADFASLRPAEILEMLGPDGVKNELLAIGLKCGGRPLARAERLGETASVSTTAQDADKASAIGTRRRCELMISHVLDEFLAEERQRSVLNIEKKQSLSWAELEAERVVEEAVAERGNVKDGDDAEEDEEEEKPLYNPKDVPLGWDGKPIPFWLYKLHGLNHEFRCEICGGTSYKGPRAFERHFTDAQHVHGLRCLEISYSKQYYMVTLIADAVKLRDKIASVGKDASFDPDLEMEFEDSHGNVLNRKTYQDLERQGLLS